MSNYDIAREIKPIKYESIQLLYLELIQKHNSLKPLSIKYNDIADYFTFEERLNTIGNKGISFYDFYRDREKHDNSKYMIKIKKYYKDIKSNKTEICIYKYIFNLYFGSITNFSIPNVMQVLKMYNPKFVLDPTCGFGNRMVACSAFGVEKYIGIDNNTNLEQPLQNLQTFLCSTDRVRMRGFAPDHSNTKIDVIIQDCLTVDYSKVFYDMVFTSLPYYNIEIYGNNKQFNSKKEWNENFYKPLIERTYKYLQIGGVYALNVPEEIYNNVCILVLGECSGKIELYKRKRNNNYHEWIYVWMK